MKIKQIPQELKVSIIFLIMLVAGTNISNAQRKKTIDQVQYVKLKKLRAAVEANPDNLKAHEAFVDAWGMDTTLEIQYKIWIKRYPRSAITAFVIGKVLVNSESPDGRQYLLRAVALNSKLAAAWELLGVDAMIRGSFNAESEYLQKATNIEPLNSEYAYSYACSFEQTDPATYYSKSLDFIKKFPDNKRCTQVLYWLAVRTKNINEKINDYDLLIKNFSKKKDQWFRVAMQDYFALMLGRDNTKALKIAQIINVPSRIKLAGQFLTVDSLLKDNSPAAAENIVKDIKLIYGDTGTALTLVKAKVADAAGHTLSAYNELVSFYSKTPSDTVYSSLLMCAQKLGFSEGRVRGDIGNLRDSTAVQATNFTLDAYLTKGKISLSDFKGKIVLLTYWFPGCGPCRNEFPHFEAVLKKIDNKDVVYLGLNLEPSQNELITPFLKSTGYSFVPLHDDWYRDKGNLVTAGAPTNYLIDQNGRIIYKDFYIDEHNERMLELMISELLQPGKMGNDTLVDSTQIK